MNNIINFKCILPNPAECKYHGLILEIEEAKQELNKNGKLDSEALENYYEARRELDTLTASGWNEQTESMSDVDNSFSASDISSAIRYQFLSSSDDDAAAEFVQKLEDLENTRIKATLQSNGITNVEMDTSITFQLGKLGSISLVESSESDPNGKELEDGDSLFIVFKLGGRMFRLDGYYSSWDDASWYLDSIEEVRQIITVKTLVSNSWLPDN